MNKWNCWGDSTFSFPLYHFQLLTIYFSISRLKFIFCQVTDKSDSRKSEESSGRKSDEAALKTLTSLSNNPLESSGMKVTATVPPLPNLMQRNQDHSTMQSQASASHNDDEGSFAAALRKLAQQAIVPTGRRPSTRERQGSPSAASHNAGKGACIHFSLLGVKQSSEVQQALDLPLSHFKVLWRHWQKPLFYWENYWFSFP